MNTTYRLLVLLFALLWCTDGTAQTTTYSRPIENGKLVNALDANGQAIKNVQSLTASGTVAAGTVRANVLSASGMISGFSTLPTATMSAVYPQIDGYINFHGWGLFTKVSANVLDIADATFSSAVVSNLNDAALAIKSNSLGATSALRFQNPTNAAGQKDQRIEVQNGRIWFEWKNDGGGAGPVPVEITSTGSTFFQPVAAAAIEAASLTVNSSLTVTAPATFSGSNSHLGAENFSGVTTLSNTTVNSSLTVSGPARFTGNNTFSGTNLFTGTSTFRGSVEVSDISPSYDWIRIHGSIYCDWITSATLSASTLTATNATVYGSLSVPANYSLGSAASYPAYRPLAALYPASISGCLTWLDADRIPSAVDGTPILTWPDASSNGKNAVNSSSANSPVYSATGGPNRQPSLLFNGSALLTISSLFAPSNNTSFTIIAVSDTNVVRSGGIVYSAPVDATYLGYFDSTTWSITSLGGVSAPQFYKKPQIDTMTYDGTTANFYRNGIRIRTEALSASVGVSGDAIIGQYFHGGAGLHGHISFFAAYGRALNSTELTKLHDYIVGKFYPRTKQTLVLDGDSIATGFTGNGIPHTVANYLADSWDGVTISTQGDTIANAANIKLPGLLARYDGRVNEAFVWWGSGNDIWNGGDPTTVFNSTAAYLGALRASGRRVGVISLLPRPEGGGAGWTEAKRQTYNTLLRTNWRSFADSYFDVETVPALGAVGASANSTYYSDVLHPNTAGYALVMPGIAQMIDRLAGTGGTVGGPVPRWSVRNSALTVVAGSRTMADTSGAAFTLTLPASPVIGDEVEIRDAKYTWGSNALTVARNGQKINGNTSDFSANVSGGKLSCVYIDSTYGWSIQ